MPNNGSQQTLFRLPEFNNTPALTEVIEEYLEYCQIAGRSKDTVRTYRYNLERWSDYMHNRDCEYLIDITKRDLRSYFAKLQARDLSPFTVDQRWRTIHTFYNWCIQEDMTDTNLMKKVPRPQLPRNRNVPRLTQEQFERLLQAALDTHYSERNIAIVLLLGDSGLRRGEVVRLNIDDVNFGDQYVDVDGKGNKERKAPLSDVTAAAVKKWLEVRPNVDHDALITDRNGERISGDAIRFVVYRLRDKVGVDRLYPHLLRHTFARLFLRGGGDLKSLQEILGHEKASTTASIYLEPDIDDLKAVHTRCSPMSQ